MAAFQCSAAITAGIRILMYQEIVDMRTHTHKAALVRLVFFSPLINEDPENVFQAWLGGTSACNILICVAMLYLVCPDH